MDPPGAEFDEEEHVQTAEPERLNGKEVAGNHRRGVGTEELAPAELRATASRRHAGLPEDLGDRRRRDTPTDTCQLADNPGNPSADSHAPVAGPTYGVPPRR